MLTLEYELGESSSQILELGKAGAQAGSQEWLEHLCLGCSRCLTLPPTRKRLVPKPQTNSTAAKLGPRTCQPRRAGLCLISVPRAEAQEEGDASAVI